MTSDVSSDGEGDEQCESIRKLLHDISVMLSRGRAGEAEKVVARALAIASGDAEVQRYAGVVALMNGQHEMAVTHLTMATSLRPDDASLHMTLGSAMVEVGRQDEGLMHLRRACELSPDVAAIWCNLGIGLDFAGKTEQARDAFERAVNIDPSNHKSRSKLAAALTHLGYASKATAVVRETLRQYPDDVDAWMLLSNLKSESLSNEDVVELRKLLAESHHCNDLAALSFVLSKALEDQGEYADSFEFVKRANLLQESISPWNREEQRHLVESMTNVFSNPIPTSVDPELGKEVIFVVSPPRSGSSLVEQILASHRDVFGCGERPTLLPSVLDKESLRWNQCFPQWSSRATSTDWQRLGEEYMDALRLACGDHARYVDKTIDNWTAVGAIAAMLPGAHVVAVHRSPLETCFSCYKQYFPGGANFTYNLDALVEYYAGFEYLCKLWRGQYPKQFHDVSYELLQEDLLAQVRGLLEQCSLDFDQACIEFYRTKRAVFTLSASQVHEPMRFDTSRSHNYGGILDELRYKLDKARSISD